MRKALRVEAYPSRLNSYFAMTKDTVLLENHFTTSSDTQTVDEPTAHRSIVCKNRWTLFACHPLMARRSGVLASSVPSICRQCAPPNKVHPPPKSHKHFVAAGIISVYLQDLLFQAGLWHGNKQGSHLCNSIAHGLHNSSAAGSLSFLYDSCHQLDNLVCSNGDFEWPCSN